MLAFFFITNLGFFSDSTHSYIRQSELEGLVLTGALFVCPDVYQFDFARGFELLLFFCHDNPFNLQSELSDSFNLVCSRLN